MKKQEDEESSRIEMSETDLEQLLTEVKSSSLSERSKEVILKVLLSYLWINQQLEQKTLSVKKLMRAFFGPKTEKSKKRSDKDPEDDDQSTKGSSERSSLPKSDRPKPKGHGKNGLAQFKNAEKVRVDHPFLKSTDKCPSCLSGRLYQFRIAAVLRLFGQAPIVAKIFELERLRCSSCQEVFTAPLPEEAGPERHHMSANAMVAMLNYGAGMPFYRLEGLQKQLNTPLPDSTQFDLAEDVANCGRPIVEHWRKAAAKGDHLALDDTPMPILSLIKENKGLSNQERKGMQTTTILSQTGVQQIVLFATGRNHAGENMGDLLSSRDPTLPKAIQMSDASTRNFSHEYMNLLIKALCLDHGRREFTDLLEFFPQECQLVVSELARIYENEADAKKLRLSAEERLLYHQEHSRPVMNQLNAWMEEKFENHEVEPNSSLGSAIQYFLNNWNGLTTFLRVPGAPLSNAAVERLIKRCVLRRKSSLFYRTQVGAWVGDILMSLIETARLAGKNPFDYLLNIQKYAKRVREYPEHWQPWNYEETIAAL